MTSKFYIGCPGSTFSYETSAEMVDRAQTWAPGSYVVVNDLNRKLGTLWVNENGTVRYCPSV